ncbi:hypothetical protein DID80_07575 [Candidatus Marinamargulisbacteria bacterium SCGC AAA071-K20]|nr:hypothetical protein DID80_07575 [Candidatus Marinamargulisbacteria bacterium SCGC AAA071-K20]
MNGVAGAKPVVGAVGAVGVELLCKNSVSELLKPLMAKVLEHMNPCSILATSLLLGGAGALAARVLPGRQSPVAAQVPLLPPIETLPSAILRHTASSFLSIKEVALLERVNNSLKTDISPVLETFKPFGIHPEFGTLSAENIKPYMINHSCILHGHTDWVNSVTQLEDGRLVSASNDNTLKVWDLTQDQGQECVATLQGHTSLVRSVTQLEDGRLVSASFDSTLKVWDLTRAQGQECVATLEGHTDAVSSVTQLEDGRLISASDDNTLKVWGAL